ncbi:hypothetical protein V5799_006374 [Amblyomma americanum]|uniref:Uncharacterized protein n=1 Tax=Amblyomma americanum TaxID=6943 RepID=A0AAQ4DWK5_AMBAM
MTPGPLALRNNKKTPWEVSISLTYSGLTCADLWVLWIRKKSQERLYCALAETPRFDIARSCEQLESADGDEMVAASARNFITATTTSTPSHNYTSVVQRRSGSGVQGRVVELYLGENEKERTSQPTARKKKKSSVASWH